MVEISEKKQKKKKSVKTNISNSEFLRKYQIPLLFLFLTLTWGSSFILMKRGLFAPDGTPVFSPEQVGAYRMFATALVLLPVVIKNFKLVLGKKAPFFFFIGFVGNALPAFLQPFAQEHIDSSLAGLLNSLVPFFTLLVAVLIFKEGTGFRKVLGIVVGFIGAAGLITLNQSINIEVSIVYPLLVVIACVCYAFNINVVKRYLSDVNPIVIVAIAFFYLFIPVGIYLFTSDFVSIIVNHDHGMASLGYISILSVIGTAIALSAYNRLIILAGSVTASSVIYLIPIVGVMWGVFDGELFTMVHFVFAIIILLGIYMLKKS